MRGRWKNPAVVALFFFLSQVRGAGESSEVATVHSFDGFAASFRSRHKLILIEVGFFVESAQTIREDEEVTVTGKTGTEKPQLDGHLRTQFLVIVKGRVVMRDLAMRRFRGGVATVDDGGQLEWHHCEALENQAQKGAVVSLRGGSTFVATDCLFSGNVAFEGGGAVALASESHFLAYDCHFQKNEARRGGALHVYDRSTVKMTNCLFDRSKAFESGGAFFIDHLSSANATDTNFSRNDAPRGPSIYIRDASSLLTTNCTGLAAYASGSTVLVTGDYDDACTTTSTEKTCAPDDPTGRAVTLASAGSLSISAL